jgi:hypothetical protein
MTNASEQNAEARLAWSEGAHERNHRLGIERNAYLGARRGYVKG